MFWKQYKARRALELELPRPGYLEAYALVFFQLLDSVSLGGRRTDICPLCSSFRSTIRLCFAW